MRAALPVCCQTVADGPTSENRISTKREGNGRVTAPSDPSVEIDFPSSRDRIDDPGQRFNCARETIELAATMIRYHDRVRTDHAHRAPGIVRVKDALDHERSLPSVPQPGEVVPVECALHVPLHFAHRPCGGRNTATPRTCACA